MNYNEQIIHRQKGETHLLMYHNSHSMLYFVNQESRVCIAFSEVRYMQVHQYYSDLVISKRSSISGFKFTLLSDSITDEVHAGSLMIGSIQDMSFNPSAQELFRYNRWTRLV